MSFTPDSRARVGVLISGRGSNLGALIEAASAGDFPAEIATVISNRADAAGLELAREAGITAQTIDHQGFESRGDFEDALTEALEAADVDIVCNAGFMRLLTPRFTDHWRDRHLNIHPSLLPSYTGLHTHERTLADGVRISGCTVHIVREEMDEGPIVAQAAVPVLPGDSPDVLADRILEAEHRLYPHALRLIASGAARVTGERVEIDSDPFGSTGEKVTLFSPGIRS